MEAHTRAIGVGGLLAEQGVTLGPLDRVEPGLEVGARLGTVRMVTAARTGLVADPLPGDGSRPARALSPGARVRLPERAEGAIEQTYRVRYEDSTPVGPASRPARHGEPVDKVIGVGPAPAVVSIPPHSQPPGGRPGARRGERSAQTAAARAPAGGPDGARRSMTMVATAYDPGPASARASPPATPPTGSPPAGCAPGTASSPSTPGVIPLGTRLYIPGYGNAVAGDTAGGAIKGNRIDLGYATYGKTR